MKTLDYLAYVLPYISLQTPDEQALREKFAKIGIVAGKPFSLEGRSPEERKAIEAGVAQGIEELKKAINAATSSKGLLGSKEELGGNYLNRAAGVGAGIFGNSPAEAVYVGAAMAAAKPGEKYVLTFPPGQLPPVAKEGFWSITMYDLPQRLTFHNPLERYALGDRSAGLKSNEDGSLSIYMQPELPGADKEANWLPTPPGGPFFYVVRLYLPTKSAQDGTWKDPKPVLAQ